MRVDSQQVAHMWANQSAPSAHGSANTSFDGPVLYSYRQPIGRLVTTKLGRAALYLDRSFSVTTSKHQSWMRGAAYHMPSFNVADISERPDHKRNLKDYEERIARFALACSRARDKERASITLSRLIAEARQYCAAFGLSDKRFNTDDITAIIAKAAEDAKRTKAREARKDRERIAMEQAKVAAWIAGDSNELPRLPTQFARIERDELVTTLGARVPLDHAVRAARLIDRIIASGKSWHRNGDNIHVGHFQIDSVSESGEVRAGCHTFAAEEVKRIVAMLGALVAVAS